MERWTAEFWDERYASRTALWSGHVNAVVMTETARPVPGRALDIGCGEGGDALWLAARGWQVVGVDVSQVALDRAAGHAREAGPEIADRIELEPARRAGVAATRGVVRPGLGVVLAPAAGAPQPVYAPPWRQPWRPAAPSSWSPTTQLDISVGPRPPEPDLFFTPEELAAELDEGWEVVTSEARPRPGRTPTATR